MFRGYARYSYDQVSNSLASSHGIRARHRRYAVPGRDNSRDSVSEQKMRLCRTHASKRRCFPWSRARARLRNSPRNCGHDVNSRLIDEFRRIPASRFPRSSRLKFRYGEISGLIEPAPFYLRPRSKWPRVSPMRFCCLAASEMMESCRNMAAGFQLPLSCRV